MLKKYLSALFLLPFMVLAAGFTVNPDAAVIRVSDAKLFTSAAKDLQLNLKKLTGKKIPIANKGTAVKGKFVFESAQFLPVLTPDSNRKRAFGKRSAMRSISTATKETVSAMRFPSSSKMNSASAGPPKGSFWQLPPKRSK